MKRCTKCGKEKPTEEFVKYNYKLNKYRSTCLECDRKRYKKYREANPEKARESQKKYREANPEKDRERQRKYREQNREKIREKRKKYREQNREKFLEIEKKSRKKNRENRRDYNKRWAIENKLARKSHKQNRRARYKQANGKLHRESIKARFEYYGNKCYYCSATNDLTIEHRIPLSRGGTNWPSNIVPACGLCNSKKGTKTEKEFINFLSR